MPSERSRITWDAGTVSAAWHHPAHGGVYLALGHGAGGTLDTPDLVTYADGLAQVGIGAVRFNFLYAEDRRKAPDRQAVLEDCYRAVADQVRRRAPTLFLGGRSMGGRIASHIVASGTPAAGLVSFSATLCTLRANRTGYGTNTSTPSKSRCCSCRGPATRLRSPTCCSERWPACPRPLCTPSTGQITACAFAAAPLRTSCVNSWALRPTGSPTPADLRGAPQTKRADASAGRGRPGSRPRAS